jgi:hypothetical protein
MFGVFARIWLNALKNVGAATGPPKPLPEQ